jgi:hypothetical protein
MKTLTLATNFVADTGVYNYDVTVTLLDYPAVPGITKSFQVTIICEVLVVAFSVAPTNMLFKPGVTPEPFLNHFSITQQPDCSNPVVYSLATTVPTFVTIEN